MRFSGGPCSRSTSPCKRSSGHQALPTAGAVQVADNGQQVLVAEGKTMSVPDSPQGNDQGNNKKKGGAVRVPGGTSVTGPILIGLGAATGLALLVYFTTRPCHPVSPTGSC